MINDRLDKNKILEVLKSKKDSFFIDRFILFGSYAKGVNHKNSDIDVAYILKDGYKLTFEKYLMLESELSASLKNKIDLMNFEKLNPLVKLNAKKDFIYV
ncbi:MAG: nucleotidyltransferase domain-containing protein [Campylobacterales bacterium]|nr:nucleotidyltransferase domain-containing protein [Campylobacterales bacterium]